MRGEVHDAKGKPLSGAILHLQTDSGPELQTARTDENGRFSFSALDQGVYALRAQMSGYGEARLSSIFVAAQETKTIDFTLGVEKSQPRASSAPEFFDQPQFTVSGVTDTTSLGGHGSDTIVRTRDTIAKDTASLGKGPTGRDPAAAATEADLRAKVEHDPNGFEQNRELGAFLVGQGSAREALQYLDRAAKLRPADYKSAYTLALANADTGNYERAREIAESLLPHHNQGELHHLLADAQEKLGNSLEAVREYERAATLDPSEPYLFDWGSELLLHHAPEPALEVFTKGRRLFPHSVRMLIGIGATWFARGSYDLAIEQICEASDLDPKHSSPYLFLGRIEFAQAIPPETLVEKLHRFVMLQPENAAANYYYAVGLWKRRKTSGDAAAAGQVESLLNQAIHLDAKFAAAYLQRGILHSDQGDFSRAVSDYQQAIQADPKLEEAHYRLAQAYRQIGAPDRAKAELQLYDLAVKETVQRTERERHEIRQFVYTLRDQPPAQKQ